MSTLSNRSLDASYIELLKIDPTGGVNTGISASLANVETGNGTASALRLSTTQVHSTGTLTSAGLATLNSAAVTNNATIGGTLGVTGLLTATGGVSGALTGNVTGNVAGDVTGNVTGNLSGNVNGTIGATTPNSGSFTTLGASGSSTLSSVSATSLTVSGDASFTGSGGLKMPVGATAGATGRPASPAQGMLRYNTSLNQFEGYDGSSWAPIASGGGGGGGGGQTMYVRQTFTATASQTTFTITGGYTAYKLDVFQNGVKLVNSDAGVSRDVDVSNGTTIVLATGAAVGDVIDVIGLTSGNFAGPATARRQNYTATAGQTTFTVSGGYTVGQLDVFQNGTKLVTAVDVDVSNGSTFTLTTPAVAGDSLEVVGFTAADTVSGTLQFQAGTAAAPSITTFGDTNTGIFFPAADTIAFAEGGAEAMRIDSSGNVGIGTTSPASKFHVYNTNTFTGKLTFGGVAATGTVLNNEATGNVYSEYALGTWNLTRAKIRSEAGSGGGDGVGGGVLTLWTGNSSGAQTERLRIDSSGNVGVGTTSPLAVAGYTSLTLDGTTSGLLEIKSNGIQKGVFFNDGVTRLRSTGPLAFDANSVEVMRIDGNANVGIGIATGASAKLDVQTTGDGNFAARFLNSTASGSPNGVQIVVGQNSTNAVFDVAQGTSYTSPSSLLRILGNGNVGIGTSSPSAKLELSSDSAKKPSTNTWTIASDQRLKANIINADNDRCYEIVKQVPLKRYTWKSEVYSQEQVKDRSKLGWIAQDVEAVFPKAVGTNRFAYNQVFENVVTPELDSDGNAVLDENGAAKTKTEKRLVSENVIEDCKNLNSDQIYAAMYGTIQKLIEKVELLESKVATLEAA